MNPSIRQLSFGCASVQGQAHIDNNKPCQDASICEQSDSYTLLVAADGLGSSSHAEIGAQLTTEAASRFCQQCRHFCMKRLFKYCRATVLRYASDNDLNPEQLHTTLLCAVIKADELHIGQIGDGAIVIKSNGTYQRCFQSFYNDNQTPVNVTATLLQQNCWQDFNQYQSQFTDMEALYLMTDGVTPVAITYKDESPYPAFFDYLNNQIIRPEMPASLASKRIASLLDAAQFGQHSTDDKTLVYAINNHKTTDQSCATEA